MKPFIPKKLPLEEINQTFFINELIEANGNIVRYQTMLNSSKVPWNILINPLLLQEAVQSTKIEGTQVTIDEVLESELDNNKKNIDVEEVMNYYRALNYGKNELKRMPLSTRMFKELHKILLGGNVRGKNRTPGEYRTIQNFIGAEGCTLKTASFIPPEPQLVNEYISNLEEYINNPTDNINPLIRIAIIHAQFETIHPFLDGNGRIGRILIPLYLYESKIIEEPNFFISDTLEKDKHKYYRLLNDTRFKNNWNEWIKFFIESINMQAKKNIEILNKINERYEADLLLATAAIKNSNIIYIIESMYQSPIFNVNRMSELTGMPNSTCRKCLYKLEDLGLIYSDGKARNRTYYNYNLLDILR